MGPTLSTVAQPRAIQRPNASGVGLAQPPSPTGAHVAHRERSGEHNAFQDLTRTVELTRPRRWVVRGNHPAKVAWDLTISLLLLLTYASAPVLGAFYATADAQRCNDFLWGSGIADFLLLCDLFLASRTTYLDPRLGATITDPAYILGSYARGALLPT